jgi:hypothetical protein
LIFHDAALSVTKLAEETADLASHLLQRCKAFDRAFKAAKDRIDLVEVLFLEGGQPGVERGHAHSAFLSILRQMARRVMRSRQVAMMAHASPAVIGTRAHGRS